MTNPYREESPFFLQSTVLMLDDDPDFLQAMRGALANQHAILCYTSPKKALSRISLSEIQAGERFQPFTSPAVSSGGGEGDQLVVFQASKLEALASDPLRYDIVSVVIVDEVMPEMTGLDFCHQLQGTGVRTILLTGKITEPQDTIDAFNAGIIDRFISKGDVDAIEKVSVAIIELHEQYFIEKSSALHRATLASRKDGVNSADLSQVMDEVYKVFPFCEYYFHSSSGGILLMNAGGHIKICLFATRDYLFEVANCLDDQNPGSLDAILLRNGTHLLPWAFLDEEVMFSNRADELLSFEANLLNGILWCLIEEDEMPVGLSRMNSKENTSWKEYRRTLSVSELIIEKAV